jgi:inner membrane protein
MASVGHIAVGMAASRVYRRRQIARWSLPASMLVWSILSFLPDTDVIGYFAGVAYDSPFGHRGATHSFLFAGTLGMVALVTAKMLKVPAVRTALFVSAVVASHPILDTMTNGGRGCALLWPFDDTRYFAPWNPIPVAPIGLYFFSRYGMMVAAAELALFSPVFLFALWPRRDH